MRDSSSVKLKFMKSNQNLFSLIKSMSPTEKRYFRMQSAVQKKGKTSNSLALFDLINNMDSYNEAALLSQINNEKLKKNLSTEKVHLYNSILRSLRAYHSSAKPETKIRNLITDVEILNDKGLYKPALQRLKQAWKLADKFEYLHFKWELLTLKRRLLIRLNLSNSDDSLQTNIYRRELVLAKLQNLNSYLEIYDNCLLARLQFARKDRNPSISGIESLADKDLLSNPQKALTAESKLLYYAIWRLLSELGIKDRNPEENKGSLFKIYQQFPFLKEKIPQYHLSALYEYISLLIQSKNLELVPSLIHELSEIKVKNQLQLTVKTRLIYELKTELFVKIARYDLYKSLLPGYDQFMLEKFDTPGNIHRTIQIANSIRYLFILEDFDIALARLLRIINEPKSDFIKDVQLGLRLLMLIMYYEKDEIELLPYIYRSVLRYVYKSESAGTFERLVLDCLRNLSKLPGKNELANLYHKYFEEVDLLSKRKGIFSIYGLLEIRLWLKSKVTGRSMEDLIRKDSPDPPADLHLIFDEEELE